MKMMQFVATLAAVLAFTGCAEDPGDPPVFADRPETVENPIFNGEASGRLEVVHLRIVRGQSSFTCSGTAIRPNVVLTAAHCVQGVQPSAVTVETSLFGSQIATELVVHPDYDGDTAAVYNFQGQTPELFVGVTPDLALVSVANTMGVGVAPIEPPTLLPGQVQDVVGFGLDEHGNSGLQLQGQSEFRYYAPGLDAQGQFRYPDGLLVTRSFVDPQEGPQHACPGDSGSPLLTQDGAILGVTSSIVVVPGQGCSSNSSTSYVNVATHRSWILGHADRMAATLPATPHRNPHHPYDVNNDGCVCALDALVGINDLNRNRAHSLSGYPDVPVGLGLDTNQDGAHTPNDVLLTINYLNRVGVTPVPWGAVPEQDGPVLDLGIVIAYQSGDAQPALRAFAPLTRELDSARGFRAHYDFGNWGGRNERWILGDAWYFLTPDGRLFRWNGARLPSGEVAGDLVAAMLPDHYADPELLVNPPLEPSDDLSAVALALDCDNNFRFMGNWYEGYWGRGEKWFYGHTGWHHIYPDGTVHHYTRGQVAALSAEYHANPYLLVDACQ
jgi:trypsin